MFDRFLVLGAGHIGQAIVALLHQAGDDIVVADRDPARAEAAVARVRAASARDHQRPTTVSAGTRRPAPAPALRAVAVDADDPQALATLLAEVDVVINAMPFRFAWPVARQAAALGVHYFDLTEDVAATDAIRRLGDGATTVLMPQCGLAPGLVGIVGQHLLQGFDAPERLRLRVGALPRHASNALRYHLTWSTEGLVNEYCRPGEAIVDGRLCQTAALDGYERLTIDGREYEAFNTSGGLGSLARHWVESQGGGGSLRELDYKSLRYPGHHAVMRLLLADLALAERPELLTQILDHAVTRTEQDVVVLYASAIGRVDGARHERVWTRHWPARPLAGLPMTAIQATTAIGLCIAVQGVREGVLPARGFVHAGQGEAARLLGNRFGRLLDDGSGEIAAPPLPRDRSTGRAGDVAPVDPARADPAALPVV